MRVVFEFQDLVDAVCVGVAEAYGTVPEVIEVDLTQDSPRAISGIASFPQGRAVHREYFNAADLVEYIRTYLTSYHNFDPAALSIELGPNFTATVQVGPPDASAVQQ